MVIYANATILGGETVIGHAVIGSSVWLTPAPCAPHTTVILENPICASAVKD